ncbi:2-isopropylmalate synthase [Helicobacter sp. MIT 14-3879]|uniref:2-isopropylmalate synthase n=1 Tax=Helicobacter sp. MIT 14-3879 TaxID=2040649 RepID=UPI000E1E2D15|nr:2-isopropylmalate synthase [Helicobacter sp. MIT 14-3879]RDU62866.1 2-isopropylmalate synthase [Helicobacter sp. MIT 14-3879]
MKEIIKIFDTTLRDGEQSPGASMNIEEKVRLAVQLEKLGVDIIEAGFAASSPGDFEAIREISKVLSKSCVCSLARAMEKDIEAAANATQGAKFRRIHTFIATSPIHMKYKLKLSPNDVVKKAVDSVKYAKTLVDDVEFSCEDACRSDIGFLKEILSSVIEAGATTLNIPDTVGYRLPNEIANTIKELHDFIGNRAILSIHCHNDLGLAVANSLEAIKNGARQIECTINGLGERAGNSALEEIVMILKTRNDLFNNFEVNINTKEIYSTSKLVSDITGIRPQPNKAIVGKNAFAHESGIHQDGMLKHRETYEIISPIDIGIELDSTLVLGKHSGRAAFKDKAVSLGFVLNDNEINNAFDKFKALCDSKKEIFDDDLREILGEEVTHIPQVFSLDVIQVSICSSGKFCAAISIIKDGVEYSDSALGNGAVDCILKSIDRISGIKGLLKDYKVEAVTSGRDALAKVVVKVEFEPNKPALIGHGLDIDTMSATAKAYIGALNSYLSMKDLITSKEGTMLLERI